MDARCPICWSPVLEDVFTCAGCATRQHAACTLSSGGCVVAGCKSPARPADVRAAQEPRAPAKPQAPSDAYAEVRAAKLARLSEAARQSRAAREARVQAPATDLDASPWTPEPPAPRAPRPAPRPATRPGHLAGVLATPPVLSTAAADPRRGWFGRVLDSAFETLAVAPRAVPLLLACVVVSYLPVLTMGTLPIALVIGAQFVVSFLSALLAYTAITVLLVDPDTRAQPWSELLPRALALVPRTTGTAIAIGMVVTIPMFVLMPTFKYGGFLLAIPLWLLSIGALILAPVIACTSEPKPLLRSIALMRAHPLSAVGAFFATAVIPSLAAIVVGLLMMSAAFVAPPMLFAIASAVVLQLIGRVWPIAYLSLLYRDLEAR